MYVATFYSFKGGVGRTLALVNVGVELAQTGRRVLLVDFDLEAPGIHTFDLLKAPRPHPGLVEYVTDFIASRSSPDVRGYVYEVPNIAQGGGCLWVMPAGKGDDGYQIKLATINWQNLYTDLDGYLMFEDLKAQWQETFKPDYVLIDSRTGHTDVEGICTRQLPDAVVVFLFPNEQNLAGLTRVVADVRAEAAELPKARTHLHFVMSNVPDLDDEEQILRNRMLTFRKALDYRKLAATVHRYESLSLLNQAIFVRERPRSRLTKEYQKLMKAIVVENLEDRMGAVSFLKDLLTPRRSGSLERDEDLEIRLQQIREKHPRDPELLCHMAMLRKQEGRVEEALTLLERAVELGKPSGEVLVERASTRQQRGDIAGALLDIKQALDLSDLGAARVEQAVRILRELDEPALVTVPESLALISLDPAGRLFVAGRIKWNRTGLAAASKILHGLVANHQTSAEIQSRTRNELSLCLIGLGRFSEAMELIHSNRPKSGDLGIVEAFNYAMAFWGESGTPLSDLFKRGGRRQTRGHLSGDEGGGPPGVVRTGQRICRYQSTPIGMGQKHHHSRNG